MTITQTRKQKVKIKSVGTAAAGLLALLLFVLSFPSFVMRYQMLSGDVIKERILRQQTVSLGDLEVLIVSRKEGLFWGANHELYSDLALASFEKAKKGNFKSPEAAALIKQSYEAQYSALYQSPVDPFGWSQYAYLSLLSGKLKRQVALALLYSAETGPYEPDLILSHIEMAYSVSAELDPDLKEALPRMFRQASRLDKEALLDAAEKGNFTADLKTALQ